MSKRKKTLEEKKALANQLNDLWCKLEETNGEQASYLIACKQLNIQPDYGYELLALIADKQEK